MSTATIRHYAYEGIETDMPQAWWDHLADISHKFTVQRADPLSFPVKAGLLCQFYGANMNGYAIHQELTRYEKMIAPNLGERTH